MDLLLGLSTKNLISLVRQKGNNVEPKYYIRFVSAFIKSGFNSYYNYKENKISSDNYDNIKVEDPIFIIGHWRSGTTFLHNLLVLDDQFAYPNIFEISNPGNFLHREDKIFQHISNMTKRKRPMDNIEITLDSPGEDEFAISALSLQSPLLAWVFPENIKKYRDHLTLTDVSDDEIKKWKSSFLLFLKKLTKRYNKRLLLKSPTHTGKIPHILDLFPNAKFIHIYREPEDVFKSTKNLYKEIVPLTCLQEIDEAKLDGLILSNYKILYEKYLEDRKLVESHNLIEIEYSDLVENKLLLIKNIYNHLGLTFSKDFENNLNEYVKSQNNYKTNSHSTLSTEQKELIKTECGNIELKMKNVYSSINNS